MSGYHVYLCHYWYVPFNFSVDYPCELLDDPFAIALCSSWKGDPQPKFNRTESTIFKDLLIVVALSVVFRFPAFVVLTSNKRILLTMYFTDCAESHEHSSFGKFCCESICVQSVLGCQYLKKLWKSSVGNYTKISNLDHAVSLVRVELNPNNLTNNEKWPQTMQREQNFDKQFWVYLITWTSIQRSDCCTPNSLAAIVVFVCFLHGMELPVVKPKYLIYQSCYKVKKTNRSPMIELMIWQLALTTMKRTQRVIND